jgi:hypothetical protein
METTDATGPTMPFLLGVNYWPRKKAMFWWKRFDKGEVESEFAEIAAWGLDIVRITATRFSGRPLSVRFLTDTAHPNEVLWWRGTPDTPDVRMAEERRYDLIIDGGGPAELTAGL